MNRNECYDRNKMLRFKCQEIKSEGTALSLEILEEGSKNALKSYGSTKTIFEVHADGVKEVEECPFCPEPCNNDWCDWSTNDWEQKEE